MPGAAAPALEPFPVKAQGSVYLRPGESAVIGYWQLDPDTNGLAIITPRSLEDGTISMQTRLLKVTDAAAADEAVRALFPAPLAFDQYGTLGAEDTQALLRHFSQSGGADMLSMPQIVTRPGSPAAIESAVRAPSGQMTQGYRLALDPAAPDAAGGVELGFSLEAR